MLWGACYSQRGSVNWQDLVKSRSVQLNRVESARDTVGPAAFVG